MVIIFSNTQEAEYKSLEVELEIEFEDLEESPKKIGKVADQGQIKGLLNSSVDPSEGQSKRRRHGRVVCSFLAALSRSKCRHKVRL